MDENKLHRAEEWISHYPVEGGFTVPDGYFVQSKKRLLEHSRFSDESRSGFEVPSGYFDGASERILDQTSRRAHLPFVQKLIYRPLYRFAAAAVLIAVAFGTFLLQQQSITSDRLATVSDNEIIQYLEVNGAQDLSVSDLKPETEHLTGEEQYLIDQAENQLIPTEL